MKGWFLSLLVSCSLFADLGYKPLLTEFPEAFGRDGSWKHGEIEVASSKQEIDRIEKLCKQRFIRMGYTEKEAERHARIGVVAEDHYWIWVRDAVTFPGGIPGTYNRIVWKSGLSGPQAAAVLLVCPEKKIVLNVKFRHATRAWELELPRGSREGRETAEQAALRELKEETGCSVKNMTPLGEMCPDSSILAGAVPVFLGEIDCQTARHQDESEAISHNVKMTVDEIQAAFQKGYIITEIRGEKTKVYCRDPFLTYALLQAIWKKAI